MILNVAPTDFARIGIDRQLSRHEHEISDLDGRAVMTGVFALKIRMNKLHHLPPH